MFAVRPEIEISGMPRHLGPPLTPPACGRGTLTFKQIQILSFLILGFLPQSVQAYECKVNQAIAGSCFESYGRLRFYRDAPHIRIWVYKDKRMLSIYQDQLPPDLESYIAPATEITGNFLTCPFAPEHPHAPQQVCIQSTSHLDIHHKDDLP